MTVILKDIADRLNVSISTISKAVNNRPGISDELRAKILQTIEEMGYQSGIKIENSTSTISSSSPTVNLSIRINDSYLTDPFYALISQEITSELQERKFNVQFNVISKRKLSEPEFVSLFNINRYDAYIIIGADIDPSLFEGIQKLNAPTVLIDNYFNGFSSINTENVQGAQKAITYLQDLGHQEILCLAGPLSHQSIRDRYQGYLNAINSSTAPGKPHLVDCPGVSINDGMEAIANYKDIDFTAVFGCTDKLAIGAMKGLQKRGLKIPEEISVMGFDDIEWGLHTEPELTTVKTAKKQIARLATKVLFDLFDNKDSYRMDVVIGTEIVARNSTAILKHKNK